MTERPKRPDVEGFQRRLAKTKGVRNFTEVESRLIAALNYVTWLEQAALEVVGPFAERFSAKVSTCDFVWGRDSDNWVAKDHAWGKLITVAMIRRAAEFSDMLARDGEA